MDWIETTSRIFGIFGFEVGSISIQIIKGGRGGGPGVSLRGDTRDFCSELLLVAWRGSKVVSREGRYGPCNKRNVNFLALKLLFIDTT